MPLLTLTRANAASSSEHTSVKLRIEAVGEERSKNHQREEKTQDTNQPKAMYPFIGNPIPAVSATNLLGYRRTPPLNCCRRLFQQLSKPSQISINNILYQDATRLNIYNQIAMPSSVLNNSRYLADDFQLADS